MHHEAVVGNRPGETFLLSECYASIQGESSLVGTPTVFVRLYACNLRCSWCDSVYAVEGGDYTEVAVPELVERVLALTASGEGHRSGITHLCWTGGEPLLQWRSVAKAIEALPARFVHSIETDGEVDLAPFDEGMASRRRDRRVRYVMDVKCPGSAMVAKKAFENLRLLRPWDEVKFVLLDRADYEFARDVVRRDPIHTETVGFSPVVPANRVRQGLQAATLAGWILEDRMDVRLQPQIHKFLWPGKERGV